MKLKQFPFYRVDLQTAGKTLWHLPYQEARQQNVSITVENYRLISIHEMQENEKVADTWKRTKNQCEVSDVLVLNKNGEISCYYVDENYPQYLAGFIRINTSGALITMETENYQIDGKKGNWIATDTIIIDGKQFYLMEHQVYRDQAQGVILDAYGKMGFVWWKNYRRRIRRSCMLWRIRLIIHNRYNGFFFSLSTNR